MNHVFITQTGQSWTQLGSLAIQLPWCILSNNEMKINCNTYRIRYIDIYKNINFTQKHYVPNLPPLAINRNMMHYIAIVLHKNNLIFFVVNATLSVVYSHHFIQQPNITSRISSYRQDVTKFYRPDVNCNPNQKPIRSITSDFINMKL